MLEIAKIISFKEICFIFYQMEKFLKRQKLHKLIQEKEENLN